MINEELLKRANDGDIEAMMDVGDAYYFGRNVEEDNEAAGVWYRKAYDLQPENPRALKNMGNVCKYGCGVEKNEMLAMQYYRKSAMMDYAPGQYNYAYGLEKRGDEECLTWYEKAWQNGDSDAAMKIGEIYIDGELVEPDIKKGIKYLLRSIDMSNTEAMLTLAAIYMNGEKVERDTEQGLALTRRAAELKSAGAAHNLAIYYRNGEGVEVDLDKAHEWAMTAAQWGDPEQLFYEGLGRFSNDFGLPLDPERGIELMQQAYDMGFTEGATDIARSYRIGAEGFPRDPEAATHWYEISARQDNERGYDNLCNLYVELYGEDGHQKYIDILREMADKNGYMAMLLLGDCYLSGEYIEQNEKLAFELYDRAIAADFPEAYYYKAVAMDKKSSGDDAEIMRLLRIAAERGVGRAQTTLGIFCVEGIHTQKNLDEAKYWLEKADKNGSDFALLYLGRLYMTEDSPYYSPDKAVSCYQDSIEKGCSEGAVELGRMYLKGIGVAKDEVKGFEYMKKAFEMGSDNGTYNLGVMYHNGMGVEKNDDEALKYLYMARDMGYPDAEKLILQLVNDPNLFTHITLEKAQQGDAEAQFKAYKAYHFGNGVEKNEAEAMRWCRLAAENGQPGALTVIGIQEVLGGKVATGVNKLERASDAGHIRATEFLADIYANGMEPIAQDKRKAFLLYMQAAEAGSPSSMRTVGISYYAGDGVAKDLNKAYEWWRKAADLGDAMAMEKVGYCYFSGIGVPINDKLAMEWLDKAVQAGRTEAKDLFNEIKKSGISESIGGTSSTSRQPSSNDSANGKTIPELYVPCRRCNSTICLTNVPIGSKLTVRCPKCYDFFTFEKILPASQTAGTSSTSRQPSATSKQPSSTSRQPSATSKQPKQIEKSTEEKPAKRWLLGFFLVCPIITCILLVLGVPIPIALPIDVILSFFCIIMWIRALLTKDKKRVDVQKNSAFTAKSAPAASKSNFNGTFQNAKQTPNKMADKNPKTTRTPFGTITVLNGTDSTSVYDQMFKNYSGTPKSNGKAYGKYNKIICSEDFKKLEGYLLDANRILSHAQDMEYENGPIMVLRDEISGGNNGYLCLEIKIYHRPGEFNLPASDIEKAKQGLAARAFTPDGGANPYSKLEKQFVADVYGSGYIYKGSLPLCLDPDDGEWDANENCYVFRRRLSELGAAYYQDGWNRKQLIKAAKVYWEENNMAHGAVFQC